MEDNNPVKRILKNDIDKKRKSGCSPKRWIDQIKEDTGLSIATLETLANDSRVEKACEHRMGKVSTLRCASK